MDPAPGAVDGEDGSGNGRLLRLYQDQVVCVFGGGLTKWTVGVGVRDALLQSSCSFTVMPVR